MKRTIGFYPGCSLNGTAREYKESVLALAKAFDIELKEIPEWTCCGATAAHNLNKNLSLSLPALNLIQAAKAGMKEILVPCASCYNRLAVTQHKLTKDAALRKEIETINGAEFPSELKLINLVEFVQAYICPELKERVVQPFGDVVCYYGCYLVRPSQVLAFDRPEDPQSMDLIMREMGANSLDFPFKTECCGAGLSVSRTDSVARLSGKIVREATQRNAQALIVACPMCHSNLDMRRKSIQEYYHQSYDIPVLYLSQAIGLAIGLDPKSLGIQRHMVKVDLTQLMGNKEGLVLKTKEEHV